MPRMHAPTAIARSLTFAAATAAVALPTLVAHAQDAVQWRVEDGGNGHWYAGVAGIISWTDARQQALALGGDLVSLEEPDELEALATLLLDPQQADLFVEPGGWGPHIGGIQDPASADYSEPSGGWFWLTGHPINCDTEPCLMENSGGGQDRLALSTSPTQDFRYSFNDTRESEASGAQPGFVIEWSADCNGDGIVDHGQILDGTLADDNENGVPDLCEAVQWRVEDGGNGHWYAVLDFGDLGWDGSRAAAESVGGHLATLTSAEESAFVGAIELTNRGIHLGGIQNASGPEPDGGWTWITGEAWDYTNWLESEPSNSNGVEDRLYFSNTGSFGDKWGDGDNYCGPCLDHLTAVEWSADCNDDGIVDYGQILDGTFADDDGDGVPDICNAVQWRIEDGGNGHWYQVAFEQRIWPESAAVAETLGGHLATLNTLAENQFVLDLVRSRPIPTAGIAFGLIQATDSSSDEPGGGWGWVDGTPLDWTNWATGEPNDEFGANEDQAGYLYVFAGVPGTWNDGSLQTAAASVIEWSADCNADGIVDYGQMLDGSLTDCDGNLVPDDCDLNDITELSTPRTPGPDGDGIDFDLSTMSDAADTVTLEITAVGDLGAGKEFMFVYLDEVFLGLAFASSGESCAAVTDAFDIPLDTWNAAGDDGSRTIRLVGVNIEPDACPEPSTTIRVVVPTAFEDCDGSGTWDACDIASGDAADIDGNGVPDGCDPDCDGDGEPDGYEIATGQDLDCNGNLVPDACDIAEGTSNDVDADGVPDECQPDCDEDGLPDAWEIAEGLAMDCNDNGHPDNCDIAEGTSNDVDSNGVPDECKDDCNGNGLPDYWEILQATVEDCNDNFVPDECDISAGVMDDCDIDGRGDECTVADGSVEDCNGNGFPDFCDIEDGTAEDDNQNDIPDICEVLAGDLNLDGCIDSADLGLLIALWGVPDPPIGDLNGDELVDAADLGALLGGWSPCP